MRLITTLFLSFLYMVSMQSQKKVLIFHETEGFRHQSIENGIQAIQQMGDEIGFTTIVSRDSKYFIENDLYSLDLVIFLSTTGDILNAEEQFAFQNYMDRGGNFFGIHAAANTEIKWRWYGDLVGAYFKGHPEIQEAVIRVKMPQHIITDHLEGDEWKRKDEWYNFKNIRNGLNVLMTLEESSYKGGENGDFHPIAWFQNYQGGGKSIYTGLGHTPESYSEPDFLEHISRCIQFALLD